MTAARDADRRWTSRIRLPRRGVHPASCLMALPALCISLVIDAPAAWADGVVTYEVVSDFVQVANIEYEDTTGRISNQGVALPWRTDATVRDVRGAPPDGSQVRADWRPNRAPAHWVTVRIIFQGKVICQNTLDIGDATCYGITPRITGAGRHRQSATNTLDGAEK